jgi:hypothetical protein
MFGHSSSEGNRCFEHPSVASCGPCMMILRLLVLAGLQGTPQLHTEEILGLRRIEAGSGDLNYANFVPCWLSQFSGIVQSRISMLDNLDPGLYFCIVEMLWHLGCKHNDSTWRTEPGRVWGVAG